MGILSPDCSLRMLVRTERIIAQDPNNGSAMGFGLWLLGRSLRDYAQTDIRILDVLRNSSFALADHPLKGDEQELLLKKYDVILKEWKKLKREY